MKLLHMSDVHLDSNLHTNLDSIKAKQRKAEVINTFERAVDYALKNGVSGILISGDLFDTVRILKSTKDRVLNAIVKHPEITFFYVSGNHEERAFISLIENMPSNFIAFKDSWESYNLNGVIITGISMGENPVVYDALSLDENAVNIVMMHGQTVKYFSKNDKAETISLTKLAGKNIDYLALGHIHYYVSEKLDDRGVYVYPGCLEGRGYDEFGKKGFALVEINGKEVSHTFIPFAKRTIHDIEIDLSKYQSWESAEEDILVALNGVPYEDMVRVTLVGKYPQTLTKNLDMLGAKLDCYYSFKIKDNSHMNISKIDLENDLSLKGEFLRQLKASKLTEEEIEGAIIYGLKALDGEVL